MIVPVIYTNGSLGAIPIQDLEGLLEKGVLTGFCRASGWAMVGKDEMRRNRGDDKGSWRDRKCNRLLLSM